MPLNKLYERINWENHPSENTPVDEENLNKMDDAVNELDNRVIAIDATKAGKVEISEVIANVNFDSATGTFTFTRKNGSTFQIDTNLEKIAVNFDYNASTQKLKLIHEDGTFVEADLSAMITNHEFTDSQTIAWSIGSNGTVSATIKSNSITGDMLQPNYLADIMIETAQSEQNAGIAQTNAVSAKSYAIGTTGIRPGENVDNAKYYYEQARLISEGLAGAIIPMGTVSFESIPDLENVNYGWMYNISNQFTTNSNFKEGAGNVIPAGSNIYKTADGYWDVLAGSPVTGVKGINEQSYRRGNVDISPEDIGALPYMPIAGDAELMAVEQSGSLPDALAVKNRFYALANSLNYVLSKFDNMTIAVKTQAEYDALATKDANTIYFVR